MKNLWTLIKSCRFNRHGVCSSLGGSSHINSQPNCVSCFQLWSKKSLLYIKNRNTTPVLRSSEQLMGHLRCYYGEATFRQLCLASDNVQLNLCWVMRSYCTGTKQTRSAAVSQTNAVCTYTNPCPSVSVNYYRISLFPSLFWASLQQCSPITVMFAVLNLTPGQ